MDVTVPPRFLGNLLCICPALRPRPDKGTRSIYSTLVLCPRRVKDEGSNECFSRLNHTAFALAVYASRQKSLPNAQDSLPAVDQTLPGRHFLPARFQLEVSARGHPLPPVLSWRNDAYAFVFYIYRKMS